MSSPRAGTVLRHACVPLLALLALGPAPAASAQAPSAAFDYAMPERFEVPAIVGGGAAPHAGELYASAAVSPASWTVHFDACASTGAIAEYEWTIEGELAGSVALCDGFSHDFPAEGRYGVSLTVRDAEGLTDTRDAEIVVDDLLIVALGDSYASGEGVPDEPVPPEALELVSLKQVAVDSAQAAFAAAQQIYLEELADYQVTVAQLDAALAAQTAYLAAVAARDAACPLPPVPCAEATAALTVATAQFVAALADIALSNLDVTQTSTIRGAIANLRALATQARDLALAARNAAAAAFQAAQDELAAAIAAAKPEWQNERCHRSSRSWQVEVARSLSLDPHSSVTLVHLACSGATIQKGLVGEYGGIAPVGDELLAPQVERARDVVCGDACDAGSREVDAFLVSIGGNDANFAAVIASCALGEPCYDNPVLDTVGQAALQAQCLAAGLVLAEGCLPDEDTAQAAFDAGLDAATVFFDGFGESPDCGDPGVELDGCNGLDDLPANYAKLHARLVDAFGAEAASRVVLTAYPEITLDEHAMPCGWSPLDPLEVQARNLPGVTTPEMEWAGGTVAPALRGTMAMTAVGYGWTFVDRHVAAFRRHGYCSTGAWIVRAQESPVVEASPYGAVHPNADGQQAYAIAVLESVPEPARATQALAALAALAGLAARRRAGRARERQ